MATSSSPPPTANGDRSSHAEGILDIQPSNRLEVDEDGDAAPSFDFSDVVAAETQIAIFAAAANSYKFESLLKPFPSRFVVDGNEKDIEGLRDVLKRIPSVKTLKKQMEAKNCDKDVLDLVQWILVGNPSRLRLTTIADPKRVLVKEKIKPQDFPDFLLKIETRKTLEFDEDENIVHYGFHGSRMENFHSILSHGLQQHMTKTSLFGDGIYVSTELAVSKGYSPLGSCGGRGRFSCVLLVHIKDDPEHVKITGSRVSGSEGGDVPESYIIVRHNELIQARYLLVYRHGKDQEVEVKEAESRIWRFLRRNFMAAMLAAYVFVLVGVGLSRSPDFDRFLHRFGFK